MNKIIKLHQSGALLQVSVIRVTQVTLRHVTRTTILKVVTEAVLYQHHHSSTTVVTLKSGK